MQCSYDEHVIMAGYPFLDIKTRMGGHTHILAEIMQVLVYAKPVIERAEVDS